MNVTQKILTASATATVVALTCAQFVFAANVTVAGNGRNSHNTVTVNSNQNTTVSQSNYSVITNTVVNNQNTGNNHANDNGAGDVSIHTGNANATTNITVTGSTNNALVLPCGCNTDPNNVLVAGNLKNSYNSVTLNNNNNSTVGQSNYSIIGNGVANNQNTGGNHASDNLGVLWLGGLGLGGDPSITTGHANTTTNITVTGSSNNLNTLP